MRQRWLKGHVVPEYKVIMMRFTCFLLVYRLGCSKPQCDGEVLRGAQPSRSYFTSFQYSRLTIKAAKKAKVRNNNTITPSCVRFTRAGSPMKVM